MKVLYCLLFLLFLSHQSIFSQSYYSEKEELRGFWADAWNKGVFNIDQVKEMVNIASSYGYNAIIVQIRRRGDALYFPTYPNDEPRVTNLAQDFDVLKELIDIAHKKNIEVHAWVTTFLISTSNPSTSPKHVYNRHPEYLTQNIDGDKKIGEGYYLDPGHPEALQWNTNIIMDLVKHYNIDGIHLDYIRYPGKNSGYNPVAIARYNNEYGFIGKPNLDDIRFTKWKSRQITDWLRNLYVKIIQIKPALKITAATIASRSKAYEHYSQDWALWMQEGMIDANFPMNYSTKFETFQERADDIINNSYGRHVYMGIGAYLIGIDDCIKQLNYSRKCNSNGLVLFSYANNNKEHQWISTFENIKSNIFVDSAKVPVMKWKTNPNAGFITGKVVSKDDGLPLYNANIVIPKYKKIVKTDRNGNFSLLYIKPGKISVICQLDGFKVRRIKLNIVPGKIINYNFTLQEGSTSPIILDTNDARFYGHWSVSNFASDKFGTDYCYIGKGSGYNKAIFLFPKSLHGRYRVYAWYSSGGNRSTQACYQICHTNGWDKIIINQQKNGGQWNLLGTWDFSWANDYGVYIKDKFQTGDVIIADAIKLEKVE